jgi:hypothetical protein
MRLIAAVTVVTICVLPGSAAIAEQRQALCKLAVDGKTYINGLCDFEVIDPRTGACWENTTAQICARNLPNK